MLGFVGKDTLMRVVEANGWRGLKYGFSVESKVSGDVSYPYIIELAVFDRVLDDVEGLKVFHCINFMPSTQKILSAEYSVEHHLGLVGIKPESPVTVVLHLISPRVEWLNYAKSSMYVESLTSALKTLFSKVLPIPKTPKIYQPKPPPVPRSWIPSGRIGNPFYESQLARVASEVLHIDSVSTRRIKKGTRGWGYILEGEGLIDKGEFDRAERVLTDCIKVGFLPLDFFSDDQDETRRFSPLHDAMDPRGLLAGAKQQVDRVLCDLPSNTTDYWVGEKFFVMMVVEKGDIRNLLEPICDEFHVPVVSSKGWAPIRLRANIAKLSMWAEARRLMPVLLLFYDHDPAGLKITNSFRKGLEDIRRTTGWNPKNLIIERIGLNREDIDKYNLLWIDNLKTGSGRDARDPEYVKLYGNRKCESNSLFRNDDTLRAAEEICRKSIEKYYGTNAITRFKDKERVQREKLGSVYEDPIWSTFNNKLDELIKLLPEDASKPIPRPTVSVPEAEVDVYLDDKYYGRCPRCGADFNYNSSMIGRLLRCRVCFKPMRMKRMTDKSN